jgi:hypothetical protein
MKNKKNLLLLAMLITGGLELCAQQATVTSGGEATGSGGTQSFSMGQVFYSQISSSSGTLYEGIQQPYEISTAIADTDNGIQFDLLAFPNPTRDYLNLKIEGQQSEKLVYRMIDMKGQILETGPALNGTAINVQEYAVSTYFLLIIESDEIIKSFRIIKN